MVVPVGHYKIATNISVYARIRNIEFFKCSVFMQSLLRYFYCALR